MRVAADDRDIWVDVDGSGPPLVLLPGGPGLASDYLEPLASLLGSTHTVVRVDPRGCGRSSRRGPYDIDGLIADLEAVRREFGHANWRVVGHSFGGDLALAYAVTFADSVVDVHALAPTGLQNDRDWHLEYEAARGTVAEHVHTMHRVDPAVAAATLASWRDWIKRPYLLRQVADLTMRYVAILGTEDIRPAWPVAQVATLAPRGELVVVEGAGHELWARSEELLAVLGGT
jgi:proline iminopeptidase